MPKEGDRLTKAELEDNVDQEWRRLARREDPGVAVETQDELRKLAFPTLGVQAGDTNEGAFCSESIVAPVGCGSIYPGEA
jgi:hypothetical protein